MEETETTIDHRYFLQFMLKGPYRSLESCIKFCEHQYDDSFNEIVLNDLIQTTINPKIAGHGFKIVMAVCEITGKNIIFLCNTIQDDLIKTQPFYTDKDLAFMMNVTKFILEADDQTGQKRQLVALATEAKLKLDHATNLLNKWISDGYFLDENGTIYVGKRFITEFGSYLQQNFSVIKECILCKSPMIYGNCCELCGDSFHGHCAEKFGSQNYMCKCQK